MSETVLVVDDSLTVRMDLTESLRAAGLETVPCASAAEARKELATRAIAVVILDLVLPDGDGLDLLREIRANGATAPAVVLLSSEAEVRDRIRGLTTGADEYIGKPYDTGYLVARVHELVSRSRSEHADGAPLLVIDDSATFREELSEALRTSGFRVIGAATGEDGLKLAAAQRPRAIIVDGILPGMDGPTVIRRLRLDAALRRTPCVLLTATKELDFELRALDAGADAFVHKDEDLDVILAKVQAVLRASLVPSPDETTSLLAPKRILTVDDSASFRELVSNALRNEGYDVVAARSGEEAFELLSVQSVDCILLDLVMPGMGGKETCRRLKESPAVRDIPVVLLSGVEDRASVLEGLANGADDFVQKSAELEVLKARVRAQLRRRQFEDETRRVRERMLKGEIVASEARAARELAEARAAHVGELERKNTDLAAAYAALQATQEKLVQSAKMASLGALVAGVAHEINNPLAFVLSHLGTVEQGLREVEKRLPEGTFEPVQKPWQRALERLGGMRMGLERMRELVVKLRTFSRLDEGEIKLVSIRECVDSVLTILAHRLGGRITTELSLGEPDVIECMPGLLNQALMNLVTNAIDAIDGPGRIRIRSGAEDGAYVIVVEDTGHGIPEQHRNRVFEPFFTTKPVGQGTGLGLSITYSIVKKHGGTLELGDAPGGGTTAVIRLPLTLSTPG
ncbi:MAG TPA: response regulator [Polyangiaceae bacterium]|nr:response regulator [Polyangiaceae bacterium]